ncbi:histidine phosphatase family protein [Roseibium porphyridii]|uniref:Histidine phosphatase family protein n=1 Tax=Roseibium porphyridii TaxID=2866279 RepID=A0ABY8F177_9HYPH|nr:histidine phosphatase family protein [Roseibium sp. KMA01]WFE89217.1 histidine phosphatase family protein [Roseibium sp. KMA01]
MIAEENMQIVLMRHGKPELDLDACKKEWVSPKTVGEIVKRYETAALSSDSIPPLASKAIAGSCAIALSSNLPRATLSIERLGLKDRAVIDPEFRESDLPFLEWKRPKLSFFSWALIFRLLWFFGFSQNGESIQDAKIRAQKCAASLCDAAAKHSSAVLLGHGIINRLIARELTGLGWQKVQRTSEDYWSFSIYEK